MPRTSLSSSSSPTPPALVPGLTFFLLLTFNRPLSICLLRYFCWRETSSINVKAGSSSSSTKAFSFYSNTTGLSISFTILASSLHFHLLVLLVRVWNIHKTHYSSSTKAIIYNNIIVSTVIHCLLILLPLVFLGLFFYFCWGENIIHKSRLFIFIHKGVYFSVVVIRLDSISFTVPPSSFHFHFLVLPVEVNHP